MTVAATLPPPQLVMLPVADIRVDQAGHHRATLDVEDLMESISVLGVLHPIVVRPDHTLIIGRRRLEAVRRLGHPTIPARIADLDDLAAELAIIHENLSRHHLSALEEGEQVVRAREVLEAMGRLQPAGRPVNGENRATVAQLCLGMGVSRRGFYYRFAIGQAVAPDVRDALRETPIADRITDLVTLSRMSPEGQRGVVELIQQGVVKTVPQALHKLREDEAPASVAPVESDDDEDLGPEEPWDHHLLPEAAEHLGRVDVEIIVRFSVENPEARTRTTSSGELDPGQSRQDIPISRRVRITATRDVLEPDGGLDLLARQTSETMRQVLGYEGWPERSRIWRG